MDELNLHIEFLVDVLRHVLRAVNRAVLAASAAKAYHQVGETTFNKPLYMRVNKLIAVVKKCENTAIVFKVFDYLGIKTSKLLLTVVFSGIVHSATVKYIATAITRGIVGNAFLVGKTHHFHGEGALLLPVGKLRHVHKVVKHLVEVGVLNIWVVFQQVAQVVDGKWHALDEMRLFFEIATETVCSQHLKRAEQHKVTQLRVEIILVDKLVLLQCSDIFLEKFLTQ